MHLAVNAYDQVHQQRGYDLRTPYHQRLNRHQSQYLGLDLLLMVRLEALHPKLLKVQNSLRRFQF